MPFSDRKFDPQDVPAPLAAAASAPVRCEACFNGVLRRDKAKSAFWQRDGLVVIEDIPALICQSCGEAYYEDETAMMLDRLRGGGFPDSRAAREISVLVFSYDAARGGPVKEE